MNGPYPIYGPEDENWQPEPPQGSEPADDGRPLYRTTLCPYCAGTGAGYDTIDGIPAYIVTCEKCDGSGLMTVQS